MKVLLADDSELILERVQEMLTNYPQVEMVGLCKNGTETFEAIKTLKPDLVLIDLKMPGLSGLEVITETRKINRAVKFIMLTFYSSGYHREMAIQAGADYFFSKVNDFDKLELTLDKLLEKHIY